MVVPVVGYSKRHVEAMVLSHEHGHLCPLGSFAALFATDLAASATRAATHASDWDLHRKNDEHDVKNSSLAEPKGQVRGH